MRMVRRRWPPIAEPVPEATKDDRLIALRSELALLSPYASTAGLTKLRRRIADIQLQISILTGLPFGELPDE